MLLQGLFLPLSTPFYPDGRLNLRKLEHNAGRYSKAPIAGMVVLGNEGEPTLLSDEEMREVLQTAIDSSVAEKVMLAGVSQDSVAGTLELAEFAWRAGYDAVLAGVPGMQDRLHRREVITFFQTVADRSPLPVVLVSGDQGGGKALAVEEIGILARHPQVIGMLEHQGDARRLAAIATAAVGVEHEAKVTLVFEAVTRRMLAEREPGETATRLVTLQDLSQGGTAVATALPRAALKTRTRKTGFQVLGGGSARMLESLQGGATGVVPTFAACAPQACFEVVAAWKDGDLGLAEEKQARVTVACSVVESTAGGVRYACDVNGYYGGRPRLPMLSATGEERSAIDAAMRGIRS